jgi:hypothetical protein
MSQGFTKGTPIDTDPTLSLNSDIVVPSQSAVVAYVASQVSTGAVGGVTASAPILSSGGLTPNISIPVATSLVNGYLSAADWTIFNDKVPSTRTLTIDGTSYDLSADRSWTTAGGSYAAYSMKANNTGAAAVPSNFTFKDLGEQAYAATIVWNGTAPLLPINLRYRWFQMGNLVQYFFYFTYTTQGVTNSTITFDFPSGMPAPVPITGTGAAGSFIYRNQALVYTAVTSPATGTATPFWGGGIRRDTGNTKYEFFFTNGTAQTARAFYTSGFYFA